MRNFFTKHPWMKLMALSLSIVLWFFVRGERQNEKTVDVPVTYKNIPQDLIHSGYFQDTIRLRLRGPQTRLAKIDRNYFHHHIVDLAGAKPGPNSYWLYEEDFGLPFGVYATQIYPQALRVVLENKLSKEVPIRARFTGELPPGMDFVSAEISPKTVVVESFQEELDKIEFFYTEPISLANRVQNFEGEYNLDKGAIFGMVYTDKVKVVVELSEKEISETIPMVPIFFDFKNQDVALHPEFVEIFVRGPLTQVLKAIKKPPIPRLEPVGASKALLDKKDLEIRIVVDAMDDLEIQVKPEKVWVRFKSPNIEPKAE